MLFYAIFIHSSVQCSSAFTYIVNRFCFTSNKTKSEYTLNLDYLHVPTFEDAKRYHEDGTMSVSLGLAYEFVALRDDKISDKYYTCYKMLNDDPYPGLDMSSDQKIKILDAFWELVIIFMRYIKLSDLDHQVLQIDTDILGNVFIQKYIEKVLVKFANIKKIDIKSLTALGKQSEIVTIEGYIESLEAQSNTGTIQRNANTCPEVDIGNGFFSNAITQDRIVLERIFSYMRLANLYILKSVLITAQLNKSTDVFYFGLLEEWDGFNAQYYAKELTDDILICAITEGEYLCEIFMNVVTPR